MTDERPLAGVQVLEVTNYVSGPLAGLALADLGADVIKLERLEGGDDARGLPPYLDGLGYFFTECNRNKRSIAVDLKAESGAEIARALARTADVVVDNFRPGVTERLGLDDATLRAANPRVITCSVTGFGETSYRDRAAYDPILQAMSGLMLAIGFEGTPPIRVTPSIIDKTAGVWAANGVLAALYQREKTGRGRRVSVSLLGAAVHIMTQEILRYFSTGQNPRRTGPGGSGGGPHTAYEAADGRWVQVACGNDRIWARLCAAAGHPELVADPRFATMADRVANTPALNETMQDVFRERDSAEWYALLAAAGVPCGPVNQLSDFVDDDEVRSNFLWEAERPATGNAIPQVRLPVFFDDDQSFPPGAPPAFGEHTDEILRDVLGYDAGRIAALRTEGAIA